MTAPIAIENVPIPLIKPAQLAEGADKPIAIFVSRKTGKIYVRQNFAPLFDAPVTIEHPEQALGTHVYTAMDYLPDHSTFRWTVTTLPNAAGQGRSSTGNTCETLWAGDGVFASWSVSPSRKARSRRQRRRRPWRAFKSRGTSSIRFPN